MAEQSVHGRIHSVFWKGLSHWFASPILEGWGPKKGTPNQGQKLSGLLDQHATTHLHMQRMAEPVAVVPVNPRLTRRKGH